jgi:oxalate decarboxylase/phosphoglucose isomerase-like protein (cupin superfamily)
MSSEAIVNDNLAAKFATEKESPYTRWVADEGLDIIAAHYVPDLRTVELKPWERRGGRGVFINHEATRTSNDCYVCEIPAGGQLAPQRQLFEEMILILGGHGSTRVWNDAGAEVTFEWGPGSLFAIPLNAHHQHFNGSGKEAARFVSSTNMPPVINLYDDVDFVFHTARDFPGRFAGEPDYFAPKTEQKGLLLDTNFVADSINLPLIEAKERGAGGGHIRFSMAKGSMNSHISQFPTRTYKKGHRHGPGAHVIILAGTGYSLMWPEGEEPKRYDWGPGTLIVPPNLWFHQHFNTGAEPGRYLAFKHEVVSLRNAQGVPKAWISRRIGGDQIDYADESPVVRELFRKALGEHGEKPEMDDVYATELAMLPPKP